MLLAMTQLLSWSASPLYLCINGKGSVCVDFGPEDCGCCAAAVAMDDGHAMHDACCDHDHGNSAQRVGADAYAQSDPCDCTHIQISQPLCPTLISRSSAPDARLLALASMTFDLAVQPGMLPTENATACFGSPPLHSGSLPVLASAVMRC